MKIRFTRQASADVQSTIRFYTNRVEEPAPSYKIPIAA
jgi:hypothetical protein